MVNAWLGFWWQLIQNHFVRLTEINWPAVQFKQWYFVYWAVVFLAAALFLKVVWCRFLRPFLLKRGGRRPKGYLEHSGYFIQTKDRPGWGYHLGKSIPLALALGATVLLLVAIADPYLISVQQTRFEQSREIGYLRDTSASMGWRYKNTPWARAEIVQNFILRLIASRQDKKDRSFYLTFASKPWLIADFTTDNSSLLFSVATGPLVTADPSAPRNSPGKFILKKFDELPLEGGTDLYLGLAAVIKIFDDKGSKELAAMSKRNLSLKRRSIIIISDGASQSDPEPQFKILQEKGIVPYLIFLDPDREEELRLHQGDDSRVKNAEALLQQVRRYGGEAFLATNEDALREIIQRLDRLYAAMAGTKSHTLEYRLYRVPLVGSLTLYFLALTSRLLLWKFHRVV